MEKRTGLSNYKYALLWILNLSQLRSQMQIVLSSWQIHFPFCNFYFQSILDLFLISNEISEIPGLSTVNSMSWLVLLESLSVFVSVEPWSRLEMIPKSEKYRTFGKYCFIYFSLSEILIDKTLQSYQWYQTVTFSEFFRDFFSEMETSAVYALHLKTSFLT